MRTMWMTAMTCLAALTMMAAGCGESGSTPPPSTGAQPATWLIAEAPAGALTITAAKADAKEGDIITVRARLGGRVTPLATDSPVFPIVDLDVKHCGQMGDDDHCSTPWDYCCEPKSNMKAKSATVQLVDASGAPLEVDPIAAGLKPLDIVTVVGAVGPRPSPDVLTIHATQVHRTTDEPADAPATPPLNEP